MNIEHIKIYSSNVEATKHFYKTTLNFPLISERLNEFTIKVGMSAVTFVEAPTGQKPFYHFAFDVPSNQFAEAKAWVKERVELSLEEKNDEVYFQSINAKSIYFEDSSGNIVEFICRLTDAAQSDVAFSVSSLQKVSEMSIVVKDKIKATAALNEVSIFERDGAEVAKEGLSFMGKRKDATYLLLVNEGRTWFFSEKVAAAFPVEIKLQNGIVVKVNDRLELTCIRNSL